MIPPSSQPIASFFPGQDSVAKTAQNAGRTADSLNFTPYAKPEVGPGMRPAEGLFAGLTASDAANGVLGSGADGAVVGGGTPAPSPFATSGGLSTVTSLNVGGTRKWGPSGYNEPRASNAFNLPATAASSSTAPAPADLHSAAPAPWAPAPSSTSSTAGVAPPASELPPKPKQLTEKERMAAALFSGMGAATGASTTSAGAGATTLKSGGGGTRWGNTPAPPQSSSTQTPTNTSSPIDQVDLLGSDEPPGAPKNTMDLLDGGLLDEEPPRRGKSTSVDDLFNTGPKDEISSAPNGGHAPASGAMDDLLSLDVGPAQPPAPRTPAGVAAPPLTPWPISIDQLGAMWGELPVERHWQGASSVRSCEDLMRRFSTHIGAAKVEIIGSEGMAAGQFALGKKCFLHGRLDAGGVVAVAVKTEDPKMAEQVVQLCARHLT